MCNVIGSNWLGSSDQLAQDDALKARYLGV